MYDNIGKKIKGVAKFIAWLGITSSVIIGITIIGMSLDEDYSTPNILGVGIGVLLGGSFFFWMSSWFMYGFGELIDKTNQIAKNTARGNNSDLLTIKMDRDVKLKTLISWKENSLISQEEFEMKKQALLKED